MPPKMQFTREQVITAAFEIMRSEGPEGITARGVADKLGSSVGPIYSHFENIQELMNAATEKALQLIEDYSRRNWSDIPFLNMGVGFVCYARDEPILFKKCCQSGPRENNEAGLSIETLSRLREGELLKGFTDDELSNIFQKMSYLSYGMASLASRGLMPDDSTENIIKILMEAGRDIIFMTRVRSLMNEPGVTQDQLNDIWRYLNVK
ncbi:MAG: TetR/AcrR family transcriptional regulator [Candidatus Thermoplasmatota archaeon]|nr:TetR/AcrR family transcriptional regulator [Candidatus Thermoplasmatota archaeon]